VKGWRIRMTEGQVLDIMREAFYNIIVCSAPMLLISLVVGLVISIFQTVTSIQEQTLTFVPKILSIFIALLIFGSFIMNTIVGYMTTLWSNFSIYTK
jgi:flagellar biosynthetic protein FliQ